MAETKSVAIVPSQKAIAGPDLYRASTDAAHLCKEIVVRTAMAIQGRKYVRVEGWQSLAIAHGCFASAGEVERINDPEGGSGYRAIGKVIRASDGQVLTTAEGFVGDDEKTWGKRDVYAKRAMAQTRAISRACRSAFAHVVVMMDAGLETTPAEEVPREGFEPQGENLEEKLKASVAHLEAQKKAKAAAAQLADAAEVLEGEIVEPTPKKAKPQAEKMAFKFGKHKDRYIDDDEVDDGYLNWYLEKKEEDLRDPEKAKYRARTEWEIEQVSAELARRGK